jgi:hypothetical protein
MKSVSNDYISHEIAPDPTLPPLSDKASLPASGIRDSLSQLRLAVFPEEHFTITVGDADLLPENFDNANTSCACRRAREPGRQEAANG